MESCGLILLAAGASRRLGQPKQLLMVNGESLLHRSIQVAIESALGPVILVLGAHAALIKQTSLPGNIQIVEHADWSAGMASSMQAGLQALLLAAPETAAVIFMVCDQPYITASVLRSLQQKKAATGKKIVYSLYSIGKGVPALFDKSLFSELFSLQGDAGAKKLIEQYPGECASISFPLGNVDVDTREDFEQLSHPNQENDHAQNEK
jgi:molybdenum cofactor cytidylyltransferase